MSEVLDSILQQIQKLLQLASKNTNEHEAGAAMAKAQELLERHNLTYEAVTSANVGAGAREKTAVEGGYYDYERELWEDVASLNFCLYWHSWKWNLDGIKNAKGHVSKRLYFHNLVGRKVNIAATQAMASYLLQASARMTHERVRGVNDTFKFDNWANSYRRGIVARICQKLRVKRNDSVAEDEARRAREHRTSTGGSTSTTLSLMTYVDKETDANLDFIYGEGYSAKKASERAEAAAKEMQRRRGYTRWAAAHPEEAAAREKSVSRHRRRGRSNRSSTKIDYGAYWSGYDDGENLSIDHQVDRPKPAGLL